VTSGWFFLPTLCIWNFIPKVACSIQIHRNVFWRLLLSNVLANSAVWREKWTLMTSTLLAIPWLSYWLLRKETHAVEQEMTRRNMSSDRARQIGGNLHQLSNYFFSNWTEPVTYIPMFFIVIVRFMIYTYRYQHVNIIIHYFRLCGPGSSVGIASQLRAGRSGIESRWEWDFPPVQTGPGADPASCKMGTRSFPGVKCCPGRTADHSPLSSSAVMEE
jgi:hypothetical protein